MGEKLGAARTEKRPATVTAGAKLVPLLDGHAREVVDVAPLTGAVVWSTSPWFIPGSHASSLGKWRRSISWGAARRGSHRLTAPTRPVRRRVAERAEEYDLHKLVRLIEKPSTILAQDLGGLLNAEQRGGQERRRSRRMRWSSSSASGDLPTLPNGRRSQSTPRRVHHQPEPT
jgi:hypothetical protein